MQILDYGDNWQLVFSQTFGRLEDVRESLTRLRLVRNAAMHSRDVTQEDELMLLFEIQRVLRAIGHQ